MNHGCSSFFRYTTMTMINYVCFGECHLKNCTTVLFDELWRVNPFWKVWIYDALDDDHSTNIICKSNANQTLLSVCSWGTYEINVPKDLIYGNHYRALGVCKSRCATRIPRFLCAQKTRGFQGFPRSNILEFIQDGPLPVINGVITSINGLING